MYQDRNPPESLKLPSIDRTIMVRKDTWGYVTFYRVLIYRQAVMVARQVLAHKWPRVKFAFKLRKSRGMMGLEITYPSVNDPPEPAEVKAALRNFASYSSNRDGVDTPQPLFSIDSVRLHIPLFWVEVRRLV